MATGLRERKRYDTRRALTRAAQELVHEFGLDEVTIDQIAASANVAPRTFFNYFASKTEAVVGMDQSLLDEFGCNLRNRPIEEGPRRALRAVLLADTSPDGILRHWRMRIELG